MNSKERYKQIIKENDEIVSYLSDSYQRIALSYVKKARGYGVKMIDTEVKIKEVLEEIRSFDERGIDQSIAIPNITTYIEDNVLKIAKAPSNKYRIKEIIAVSIFLAVIAGYFVANFFINKKKPLAPVSNISVTINTSGFFHVEWDDNIYATEGYLIKIYEDDNLIKDIKVNKVDTTTNKAYYDSDVFCDITKTYIFEIVACSTDNFAKSPATRYEYPSS